MRQAFIVAILLQPCLLLMGEAVFAQADTAQTNSVPAISGQADKPQPAAGSLVNDVATLETSVFGQPTSDALAARVTHLELTTVGTAQTGSLRSRVDSLQKLIEKKEPANQLKGQVAEDTTLHLDPAIEEKLPAPYKTQAVVSIPATTTAALGADSQSNQHPTYRGARRFGRDLGVVFGTTLKAAAVLAGAALAASATTTAYSGAAFPSSPSSELGVHRDVCACYFYPPAVHHHHH